MKIYPNPFTKKVEIRMQIPEITKIENRNLPISICIYNVTGRLVKSFSPFTPRSSLFSSVIWDGKNEKGKSLSSGVYFAELKVNHKLLQTKKLLFLK